MARINSLTNFLDDVATAIKQKTGDNTPIPASEFDTEILSIEVAGTYQQKTLTITQNGQTILVPDTGFDAMDQVAITVNVPIKQLQSKTVSVTSNGNVTLLPDTNYDGFSEVNLQVNVPSGSGDVKLFETEQAMQADPNPSEGDLAVVYRSDIVIPSPGDTISSITPPATVVFDTAITSLTTLTIRDMSVEIYLSCRLNASQFYISDMYGTIITDVNRILYTSSDGITYTRTDGGANTYDLGAEITIPSNANANILKFLQSGGMVFEGLYEYGTGTDTDISCLGIKFSDLYPTYNQNVLYQYNSNLTDLARLNEDDVYVWTSMAFKIQAESNLYYGQTLYKPIEGYSPLNNTNVLIGQMIENNTNYLIAYMTNSPVNQTLLHYTGSGFENVNILANEWQSFTVNSSTYYYKILATINPTEWVANYKYSLFSMGNSGSIRPKTFVKTGSTATMTSGDYDVTPTYGISTRYFYASTQLTLSSSGQLFPNIVGYGKNGVVTGDNSIYDNLNKLTLVNKVLSDSISSTHILASSYRNFYSDMQTRFFKKTNTMNSSILIDIPNIIYIDNSPGTIYPNSDGTKYYYITGSGTYSANIYVYDTVTGEILLHIENVYANQYARFGDYLYYIDAANGLKKLNIDTLTSTLIYNFNNGGTVPSSTHALKCSLFRVDDNTLFFGACYNMNNTTTSKVYACVIKPSTDTIKPYVNTTIVVRETTVSAYITAYVTSTNIYCEVFYAPSGANRVRLYSYNRNTDTFVGQLFDIQSNPTAVTTSSHWALPYANGFIASYDNYSYFAYYDLTNNTVTKITNPYAADGTTSITYPSRLHLLYNGDVMYEHSAGVWSKVLGITYDNDKYIITESEPFNLSATFYHNEQLVSVNLQTEDLIIDYENHTAEGPIYGSSFLSLQNAYAFGITDNSVTIDDYDFCIIEGAPYVYADPYKLITESHPDLHISTVHLEGWTDPSTEEETDIWYLGGSEDIDYNVYLTTLHAYNGDGVDITDSVKWEVQITNDGTISNISGDVNFGTDSHNNISFLPAANVQSILINDWFIFKVKCTDVYGNVVYSNELQIDNTPAPDDEGPMVDDF